MICDVKLSGKPTCDAGLWNLINTCYENYALFFIVFTSNKELSAVSLPANRRTFHFGINLLLSLEVVKIL